MFCAYNLKHTGYIIFYRKYNHKEATLHVDSKLSLPNKTLKHIPPTVVKDRVGSSILLFCNNC